MSRRCLGQVRLRGLKRRNWSARFVQKLNAICGLGRSGSFARLNVGWFITPELRLLFNARDAERISGLVTYLGKRRRLVSGVFVRTPAILSRRVRRLGSMLMRLNPIEPKTLRLGPGKGV
jgi:hypothetical protein